MKTSRSVIDYLAGAFFNILFIVLAVAAVYVVSTRAYSYGKNLFVDNTNVPYEEITVEIPEGSVANRADAMEAGRILADAGLTGNSMIFYIQSRLNGLYDKFKPGTYTFNTQMGTAEMMDIMQRAQFAAVTETKITIPEGLNIRQIGELCESKELFTADAFVAACEEYDRSYHFLNLITNRNSSLEGYLFPDTYFLPENPSPNDLIDRMLNRFQEVFDYEMEAQAAELGYTIDQIVIIASIIEKEIKVADERALCSSIIYNRLRLNMPLQMDSTVVYVLNKQKDRLFYSDLEVDSPYNTYKYSGLPIGPICSPGKQAIIAALYPANTDYLYMVVSDEQKGEHYYTNNFDDFQDAKERYKQQQ